MAIEYNSDMRMVYYSETRDIEIVEESEGMVKAFHFYFRDLSELANLINTNKELANELKKLIGGIKD